MIDHRQKAIIEALQNKPELSSGEILSLISIELSLATLKRTLSSLVAEGILISVGKGKATRYLVSPGYQILYPIDQDEYFKTEIDQRPIRRNYNFALIREILPNVMLFTADEIGKLNALQHEFREKASHLSAFEYKKELERLAIDLSWKSSQIEGNTYTLLETEQLLLERKTASGKTKEEAVMLLNHKEAIDFIVQNPDYLVPISVSTIEAIHTLLIKDLGVDKNIRRRGVGILGTNYRPIDNEFQIRDELIAMAAFVNEQEGVFEKALILLLFLSYIQPFADGNKRIARIVSNAMLIHYGYCPLSFRSVDPMEYKKAMLVFYEQNNISCFIYSLFLNYTNKVYLSIKI
jgi:Fic family protein